VAADAKPKANVATSASKLHPAALGASPPLLQKPRPEVLYLHAGNRQRLAAAESNMQNFTRALEKKLPRSRTESTSRACIFTSGPVIRAVLWGGGNLPAVFPVGRGDHETITSLPDWMIIKKKLRVKNRNLDDSNRLGWLSSKIHVQQSPRNPSAMQDTTDRSSPHRVGRTP